jgi:hypothetical protein
MLAGSRASIDLRTLRAAHKPLWRKRSKCQSPSETEFLLNFRVHREAGWASRGRVWWRILEMSTRKRKNVEQELTERAEMKLYQGLVRWNVFG